MLELKRKSVPSIFLDVEEMKNIVVAGKTDLNAPISSRLTFSNSKPPIISTSNGTFPTKNVSYGKFAQSFLFLSILLKMFSISLYKDMLIHQCVYINLSLNRYIESSTSICRFVNIDLSPYQVILDDPSLNQSLVFYRYYISNTSCTSMIEGYICINDIPSYKVNKNFTNDSITNGICRCLLWNSWKYA